MKTEKIICATEKSNPNNKSELSGKYIRLEEVGSQISHTITTKTPDLNVQHMNFIIDIRKVDTMHDENTIVRAEQSRAEQSRAEQSRAEQSSLIAA